MGRRAANASGHKCLNFQLKKPPITMVAGKSKSREQPQQSPTTPPRFSHSATKVAVAQICRSAGFKRCQPSALEALTRISTFYLQSLAKSAASSAAVAGRTQSNLFDVVCALEELASPIGFPGASRPARCLLPSGALKELRSFVCNTLELPFAKPMPVRHDDHLSTPNLGLGDDRQRRMEIPPWLPNFPDLRDDEFEVQKRTELHWEEIRVEKEECGMRQGLLKEDDKRRNRLPLIRDRVKFRVLKKVKGNVDFLSNWDEIDGMDERLNAKI